MREHEIILLYSFLFKNKELNDEEKKYSDVFEKIKNKYEIKSVTDELSLTVATEFIHEIFEVEFIYVTKLLRYGRTVGAVFKKNSFHKKRKWNLYMTYESIFNFMFCPLFEFFRKKDKK